MIMCIIQNKEVKRIIGIVKIIDNSAFLTITDVCELMDESFKTI